MTGGHCSIFSAAAVRQALAPTSTHSVHRDQV